MLLNRYSLLLDKLSRRTLNRSMAKKKTKKVKHESFKITPPKPNYNKLFLYLVISLSTGFLLGAYFGNTIIMALNTYTP